jgi:antitoxin HigA-1
LKLSTTTKTTTKDNEVFLRNHVWRAGDHDVAEMLDEVAPGPALPPLTPGEVLLEEFMRPLGLTARALAAELGVPGNRISSIVNGSRAVTAKTAWMLSSRFGTSAELWMNLQTAHDLATAYEKLMNRPRSENAAPAGESS